MLYIHLLYQEGKENNDLAVNFAAIFEPALVPIDQEKVSEMLVVTKDGNSERDDEEVSVNMVIKPADTFQEAD